MESNLERLIDTFEKMKADGFDTNAELKWGFYFVDKDKNKLRDVYNELEEKNYILEKIYEAGDQMWTLHASKIDILTAEKLHKRNLAFNTLAHHCDVELYDGWDVEKIK